MIFLTSFSLRSMEVLLKHPKEYKLSNPYSQSAGTFVFGKLNTVFYLRGGIGRQHELFKKADLGGIAIRYFYTVGPVLAIYKPIYYKVLYRSQLMSYEIKRKNSMFQLLCLRIFTAGHEFTKGLNETKVTSGYICQRRI